MMISSHRSKRTRRSRCVQHCCFAAKAFRPAACRSESHRRPFPHAAHATCPAHHGDQNRRRDTSHRNSAEPRTAPCRLRWCAPFPPEQKSHRLQSPESLRASPRHVRRRSRAGTCPCPLPASNQRGPQPWVARKSHTTFPFFLRPQRQLRVFARNHHPDAPARIIFLQGKEISPAPGTVDHGAPPCWPTLRSSAARRRRVSRRRTAPLRIGTRFPSATLRQKVPRAIVFQEKAARDSANPRFA